MAIVLNIPDGIISYNNKISSLTILNTVQNLGDNVFANTQLLHMVRISASTYDSIYNNIESRVPLGLDIGKDSWEIIFNDYTFAEK